MNQRRLLFHSKRNHTLEADGPIRGVSHPGRPARGFLIGLALLVVSSISRNVEAERPSGPWNLRALADAPRVDWVEDNGSVRSLYYAGEPYRGKPTRVFAYYAAPPRADKPLPAMVLVHGGGGKAFKEWAGLWAGMGYAALAMDLAGRGPDGKPLPDGGPDQTPVQKFEDIAGGVTNAWPYHAVANVIRAVSLLRGLDGVDADRIGITGISWGGYLTCIVAGLDNRLKVAVPVYGCGFLYENSAWLKMFARLPPDDRRAWIENFDPSRYLPGCRMPVLFVNGTNDFAYPLDSYRKSYRLVSGPRTLCVTVRMPHSHPAGWAPPEIAIFVDSVLRKGRPLAKLAPVKRDGNALSAEFQQSMPIVRAQLHYTTDRGDWSKRLWHSVPAEVRDHTVRATLPDAEACAYFVTLTDTRGAVVSSPHEVVAR